MLPPTASPLLASARSMQKPPTVDAETSDRRKPSMTSMLSSYPLLRQILIVILNTVYDFGLCFSYPDFSDVLESAY
ncbi:hypothetical protein L2E82_51189 [Cichorium intybus]|nr:hypothetical protein L2E82_51189 [Cichorium intybus]